MTDEKTNRETVQDSVTNPNHLQVAEEKFIQERRAAAGTSGIKVGFGLSGGGIRSATFALGFFQSLARSKLIRHIDYLSTVSGGGYFGAFLGSLFNRLCESKSADKVEDFLATPGSKPINYLRENGRYLAPNGPSDLLQGIASIFRSWWAVHLVLGITLRFGFLLSQFLAMFAGPCGLGFSYHG